MILWAWEGPNGDHVDLTGVDGVDEAGPQGAWMPTYDILSREVPGGSGTLIEEIRANVRVVTVPLVVQDPTRKGSGSALEARLALLADQLAPEDGAGRLLATRADDNGVPLRDPQTQLVRTRALRAFYTGGVELDRSYSDTAGTFWQVAALVFQADRPYYEPAVAVSRTFKTGVPKTWFPMLPLRVGSDSLTGSTVEVNDGAVETYPIVTVHTPGSAISFSNDTTGESWTVDTSTASGQSVTIDTRPSWLGGGRSVARDDGLSLYSKLTGGLWPLARGRNELTLDVEDGTPGQTYVTLNYFPLYRTP